MASDTRASTVMSLRPQVTAEHVAPLLRSRFGVTRSVGNLDGLSSPARTMECNLTPCFFGPLFPLEEAGVGLVVQAGTAVLSRL